MNPNGPRTSNLGVCFTLIVLGVFCLGGTVFLAVYLKNSLVEKFKPAPRFDLMTDGIEIQTLEWELETKENSIKFEKELPDFEKAKRKLEEINKPVNQKINKNTSVLVEDKQAAKIKKLEEEKAELIAKKNALIEKQKAKANRTRTWSEWAEDYQLKLLLSGVLPLGIFSLTFMNLTFGPGLPRRNPLSLTDFERRCVLFLPLAIVFSGFGFFLYLWILAVYY